MLSCSPSVEALTFFQRRCALPTRRQFDLVIIMLILWAPAKGLAKMVATRHASSDSGAAQKAASAAQVIL